MPIIQVSDLNSENDNDSLKLLNPQEHDLVKAAVTRAIDTRKVVGGGSAVTLIFATDGRRPTLDI
ncbi:hypothetical protein IQ276_038085 [Desmonostoc muscorum LEGE 12446]|uniref:Uncharacterized protein n=1 Tax=Desmonostoc muscorum LEGE 12446 TaxID=1828758 RepID=A0A8J6ZMY5_DESMC|nr:hypothetical protein [Desmonostoc muscorum]MCF2152106.1 hypothetical protein [Desmonostoc muscorum LEGE 12446]